MAYYLIRYLIGWSITYIPLLGPLPLCILAAPQTTHLAGHPQVLEDVAYHLNTDFRTIVLERSNCEWAELARDCAQDGIGLGAPWLPEPLQPLNVGRHFGWRYGAESHSLSPVSHVLDDVTWLIAVLAGIPDSPATECVQTLDSNLGNLDFTVLLVNQSQGIAIAAHLFLVPVAQGGTADEHWPDARLLDTYSLDTIRGDGALDYRMFAQDSKSLWCLAGEQRLFAERFAQVRERPGGDGRHLPRLRGEVAQCLHVSDAVRYSDKITSRGPEVCVAYVRLRW